MLFVAVIFSHIACGYVIYVAYRCTSIYPFLLFNMLNRIPCMNMIFIHEIMCVCVCVYVIHPLFDCWFVSSLRFF